MNILVTGGCGMIGSNLVKKLTENGYNVFVIDNLYRGKIQNLSYSFDKENYCIDLKSNFFNLDLSKDLNGKVLEIINNNKITTVYHLADIVAGVDFAFKEKLFVFRNNILINSNLINEVKDSQIENFIYTATVCSFPKDLQDGIYDKPLVEDDQYPADPESPYGMSKLMGEYETNLLSEETKIKTSILTLHNVYGSPAVFHKENSQVIPSLIRKAINYPNEDFDVWGSGNQSRTFVNVDDVVNSLILTLHKGMNKGLIQIGTNDSIKIADLAKLIIQISNKKIPIRFDLNMPEGDKARKANFNKAKKVLNWEPKIKIEDGIEKLYNWISSQTK